jgi:hypothetical protein
VHDALADGGGDQRLQDAEDAVEDSGGDHAEGKQAEQSGAALRKRGVEDRAEQERRGDGDE